MKLSELGTEIFADGAELDGMLALYHQPRIKGFTTNPTLMRKAGVTDYRNLEEYSLETVKMFYDVRGRRDWQSIPCRPPDRRRDSMPQ